MKRRMGLGPMYILVLSLMFAFPFAENQLVAASEAQVITNLELGKPVSWYRESDIGILHIYSHESLYAIDMLHGGKVIWGPIRIAGLQREALVPLSGTNLLLITRAEQRDGAAASKNGTQPLRSYGVDAFTGDILWENQPLIAPDSVLPFPDFSRIVLRQGNWGESNIISCVDLGTGKRVWQKVLVVNVLWDSEAYLEVVGPEESMTLDLETGEALRELNISIPRKARVVAFPDQEKLVIWKRDLVTAWAVPKLKPNVPSSANTSARKLWSFKPAKKMSSICGDPGSPCGPMFGSENQLLINSFHSISHLDFETGKLLWSKKREGPTTSIKSRHFTSGQNGYPGHEKEHLRFPYGER